MTRSPATQCSIGLRKTRPQTLLMKKDKCLAKLRWIPESPLFPTKAGVRRRWSPQHKALTPNITTAQTLPLRRKRNRRLATRQLTCKQRGVQEHIADLPSTTVF